MEMGLRELAQKLKLGTGIAMSNDLEVFCLSPISMKLWQDDLIAYMWDKISDPSVFLKVI